MDGNFLKRNGSIVMHGSLEWFKVQEALGVSENTKDHIDEIERRENKDSPVKLNDL